jgi:alpha-1,2-mannosyltransferase
MWLTGVLVAVGVLTVVPSMLRTRAADLALVYGTYTVAFLLLTFALCWVLASRPNPSASAGVESPCGHT